MVHLRPRHVEQVFTIRNKRVALALEPPCPRVPVLGVSVLNFRWKKQTTESPSTPRKKIWLGKSKEGEKLFLVKERQNGQRRAEIYMRPDGLFEGRIYRQTPETASEAIRAKAEFEICGVTETLPRVETLVDEELGL